MDILCFSMFAKLMRQAGGVLLTRASCLTDILCSLQMKLMWQYATWAFATAVQSAEEATIVATRTHATQTVVSASP